MPAPQAEVLRITQGATVPLALQLTMPAGDLTLAAEITLELRVLPTDATPLVALTLGGGAITITDAEACTALAVVSSTISAQLPLGRLHWVVWLDLTTGESYDTCAGIALVSEAGR